MTFFILLLAFIAPICAVELNKNDQTRVSYRAEDQGNDVLLPTLSALSGERYEPVIDLLLDGVTSTRASLVLHQATPASCRQALAFALHCWWTSSTDALDNKIWLTTQSFLPQGTLSVRSISSILRNQPGLQPVVESILKPWLGGDAGISLLPVDGLWTASLDEAGHRRLIEVLSLLERPQAVASTLLPDPDIVDMRRMMREPIYATSWSSLMTTLSQSCDVSVAMSPHLCLRVFPKTNINLARSSLGEIAATCAAFNIRVFWRHGVLCLGEADYHPDDADREHPAQRRHLAMIPISHLVSSPVDGELIATALRQKVASRWWEQPGAAIYYIAPARALLIGADIPTQQVLLEALNALDRVGLELGIGTLGAGQLP
jgi:hypothetical protein